MGSAIETRPSPRHGRYETLDVVRGFACLIVVAVHANQTNRGVDVPSGLWESAGNFAGALLNRGWVSVPAFFVISGYGISQAVDGLRQHDDAARQFVARRFFRLFPPYLASMVLFTLMVLLAAAALGVKMPNYFLRDPGELSASQWIGNYSLTETCRHHIFGTRSNLLVKHHWTLNYELQFYAIVALILVLASTRYLAIAALITLAVIAIHFGPLSIQRALDGFIVRQHWIVFAAGILLYWQVNYATVLWRRCCNLALLATLVIAMLDWDLMTARDWSPWAAVAFTAAFTLVLANVVTWDRPMSRTRWLAPLAACGAFSYSIYLTHPLIVRFPDLVVEDGLRVSPAVKSLVVVPVVVLLSIGLGYLYYWGVERHFTGSSVSSRRAVQPASVVAVAKN